MGKPDLQVDSLGPDDPTDGQPSEIKHPAKSFPSF